jgi:hypothetical protein
MVVIHVLTTVRGRHRSIVASCEHNENALTHSAKRHRSGMVAAAGRRPRTWRGCRHHPSIRPVHRVHGDILALGETPLAVTRACLRLCPPWGGNTGSVESLDANHLVVAHRLMYKSTASMHMPLRLDWMGPRPLSLKILGSLAICRNRRSRL